MAAAEPARWAAARALNAGPCLCFLACQVRSPLRAAQPAEGTALSSAVLAEELPQAPRSACSLAVGRPAKIAAASWAPASSDSSRPADRVVAPVAAAAPDWVQFPAWQAVREMG